MGWIGKTILIPTRHGVKDGKVNADCTDPTGLQSEVVHKSFLVRCLPPYHNPLILAPQPKALVVTPLELQALLLSTFYNQSSETIPHAAEIYAETYAPRLSINQPGTRSRPIKDLLPLRLTLGPPLLRRSLLQNSRS